MSGPETPSTPTPPTKSGSYTITIVIVLLLLGVGAGYYFFEKSKNPLETVDEFHSLNWFYKKLGENTKLAEGYTDVNNNLIADAPTAPDKFLTVTEIGFSVVGTDDEERLKAEQEEWKDLMAALEKATGKKVTYVTDLPTPNAQIDALKAGKLHVTAFNTGSVQAAVNLGGFNPMFCPADAEGKYAYQMQILVKADSPIQKPEDLKGKTLGFVALSSNSGAKAPMYILKEKFNLLPGRDYKYKIVGGHTLAIGELLYGTGYDAVCVASDLKERAVTDGKIRWFGEKDLKDSQFRVIYTSEMFPPLCFGVPHNLPKDVRTAVEKVFTDFKFANSSAKRYAGQGKVKFAPVNYEKDWKYVREIDAALSKFVDIP